LTREKLWAVFKHFDVDNSNCITIDNLKDAMARSGRMVPEEDLRAMISEISTDGKVHFEEFCALMTSEQVDGHQNAIKSIAEISFLGEHANPQKTAKNEVHMPEIKEEDVPQPVVQETHPTQKGDNSPQIIQGQVPIPTPGGDPTKPAVQPEQPQGQETKKDVVV
jgi:hypothetical protein